MPFDRTMTAPLGIIKVGGVAVGKCKNLRLTEVIRRGDVVGIGKLASSEKPALAWNGTLTMGFYLIDFSISPIPGAVNRNANSIQQWEDTLILQDDGVQIDLMRKVAVSTNAAGIITSGLAVFASIMGAFANREGFDITENQISGRDMDFDYITPILYPI
jgi:hypothetical protein